jgi:hypothetical protein
MIGWIVRWIGSAFLIASATVQASADCALNNIRTDQRPGADGGATQVSVAFVVADLLGVDDVGQQLDIDLIGTFKWRDPRLVGLEGCRFTISEVWFPRVILFNSSDLRVDRTNALDQVAVGEDGNVTYTNRFTGLISSYHDLRQFPFDAHDFEIELGSIEDEIDSLEFVADDDNTWIANRLNIEGWAIQGVSLTSGPTFVREAGLNVSTVILTISAARNPDYYIYRVMALLFFVVAMSWAIFFVPPSRFEFQIGLGATSMLTAIAFSLSIAGHLPRLGYLTILDKILIWAIFLVFLSIVEALISGLMVLNDNEAGAHRVDWYSRIVFPALLLGGWALMIMGWV